MKRKLTVVFLAVTLLLHTLTVPAMALTVNDVAGEFICNCGCNKILSDCDMGCGKSLRAFIGQQIDKGLNKAQIMQFMKVNFSEALLAAPEKTGFNLIVAWILPFVLIILAAVIVARVISGWVNKRKHGDDDDDDEDSAAKPKIDAKYSERIQKELKEFGW